MGVKTQSTMDNFFSKAPLRMKTIFRSNTNGPRALSRGCIRGPASKHLGPGQQDAVFTLQRHVFKTGSCHVSHLGGRGARSKLLPLSSFERKCVRFIKQQSVLRHVSVTKMCFGVRTPGHCLQPGVRGLQLLLARRPTQLPLVSGSVDPGSIDSCQVPSLARPPSANTHGVRCAQLY